MSGTSGGVRNFMDDMSVISVRGYGVVRYRAYCHTDKRGAIAGTVDGMTRMIRDVEESPSWCCSSPPLVRGHRYQRQRRPQQDGLVMSPRTITYQKDSGRRTTLPSGSLRSFLGDRPVAIIPGRRCLVPGQSGRGRSPTRGPASASGLLGASRLSERKSRAARR